MEAQLTPSKLNRRLFCKQLLVIGAIVTSTALVSQCQIFPAVKFASAFTDLQGKHFVGWFDINSNILGHVEIPERAHDLTYREQGSQLLAFSRRPGNKLFIININRGNLERVITTPKGQHFYGHGVLSPTGDYLYTSENRFDDSYKAYEGLIVVRNTVDYKVEAEYLSGGVGPHQVGLINGGEVIVVANGGIHTHPNSPRTKLNLPNMQPNLTYLSSTGALIDSYSPPDSQLSIRHLCTQSNGMVYVGCQYQGPKHHIMPLVYRHKQGQDRALTPLTASQNIWRKFAQYTASLALDENSERLAVTSPRGGVVAQWATNNGQFHSIKELRDCAGVASSDKGFLVSTGRGELVHHTKNNIINKKQNVRWDNHMVKI